MGPDVAALGAAEIIPAALSLGGMLMQQQAMTEAQDDQRAAMNRMLDRDAQYAGQAQQLVTREAQNYQPAQREQAEQQAEQQAYGSLASKLTAAATTMPTSQVAGKVSDDFLVDKARRTGEEMTRSADTARLMAKMRAPNDLRFGEGLSRASNAAEVGSLARDRASMAGAGGMEVQRAGQPEGAAMMLGQAAQTIGTTMLGRSLLNRNKAPAVMGAPTSSVWSGGQPTFS